MRPAKKCPICDKLLVDWVCSSSNTYYDHVYVGESAYEYFRWSDMGGQWYAFRRYPDRTEILTESSALAIVVPVFDFYPKDRATMIERIKLLRSYC